ncbi:MAG: dTDP-4-dehydrorhamnose 3,5-epimerase family protein [Candidatus Jordarchaeaceae archaeon]
MEEPRLIKGGIVVDDRGLISFVNDFDFHGVKRFYMVQNHCRGFIRAWHGHRLESKYVLVIKGSALVCAVAVDNWVNPSKDAKVWRFVLSEITPAVLYIPAGYANGAMSLTEDAKIIYFSNRTLEESLKDDIRFPFDYWNPWEVEKR